MGRYRRNNYRGRHQNRKRDQDKTNATSNSTIGYDPNSGAKNDKPKKPWFSHAKSVMTDADYILVEKYLLDYISMAYALHFSVQSGVSQKASATSSKAIIIGSHSFEPLTAETCSRPYIDLPDTLGPKERRQIHTSCAFLGLYHAGAGSAKVGPESSNAKPKKRRIAISIFANGLEYVPDLETPAGNQSDCLSKPLPRNLCRPWYYRAARAQKMTPKNATNSDERGDSDGRGEFYVSEQSSMDFKEHAERTGFIQRIKSIETEKQQIHQFIRHPEQSIRTGDRTTVSNAPNHWNDTIQLDSLNLKELEALDLSCVPTPLETPWMLVDSVEKLKQCVNEMKFGVNYTDEDRDETNILHELAFDMEMHNHCNGGFGGASSRQPHRLELRTCLIQVTSNVTTFVKHYDGKETSLREVSKDYVIDPLAPGVWDAIPIYLGPLFADRNIVKIGHGIGGMDTSSLHRDFGVLLVNAFDTYEAASILSRRSSHNRFQSGLGLASLCKHYGLPTWKEYQELKSLYQCSDWRKRPLEERALEYGRYDVRYLITLRKLLMRDLVLLELSDRIGFSSASESSLDQYETSDEISAQLLNSSDLLWESNTSSDNQETYSSSNVDTRGSPSGSENETGFDNFLDDFHDAMEKYDATIMETDNDSEDLFLDAALSNAPSSAPEKPGIVDAYELQRCRHLMNAVSLSQKRCLNLWKDEDEPILRNHSLVKVMKNAALKKGHGKYWTDAHLQLYKSLAAWRKDVAYEEGMHPSELCSLDFLVHVAYKLPTTKLEMRRYGYILPSLLEDKTMPYCDQLCSLVAGSEVFRKQGLPPLSETARCEVIFYTGEESRRNISPATFHRNVVKLLVASAAVGVLACIAVKSRRK
mmetsp:Transcript_20320/g.42308  ORF Transcript_20320/g.42308 Transcript_20320/m.42308 type:complete len:870 (+) Transcript_20320:158-2767(+)